MKNQITVNKILYRPPSESRHTIHDESIEVIGLDTEAYDTGKCFMITTSEGDVFKPADFPEMFFSRQYRGSHFVTYNLKYDAGALLQNLSPDQLSELRTQGETNTGEYKFVVIANKMLSIQKGKNSIHVWDMYNFFLTSLDYAAKLFLGDRKKELETKSFKQDYVSANWNRIAEYSIHDSVLVRDLAQVLIQKFESYGVFPQKLFSTAYVSWQYFACHCEIPSIKRFWDNYPELLDYSLASYNGGKFEVTEKGIDNYYEYDISSAYPSEISNLVDISHANVTVSKLYNKHAQYGFLLCDINIPVKVFSPIAITPGIVNLFPCGRITKVITKTEYEFFLSLGIQPEIKKAYWLEVNSPTYPFRKEINKLYALKSKYKKENKPLDYHLVKILLNSLYGKFCQLIATPKGYKAGVSWNPIYASVITANTRCRVSNMQNTYHDVVAVFTDSAISKSPLPLEETSGLGSWNKETEGKGIILGSGIYQIGSKTKLRGYESKTPLMELIETKGSVIKISSQHATTWREVAFRHTDTDTINLFADIQKDIRINFDTKRLWIDDYKDFREVKERKVISLPRMYDSRIGII